MTTYTVQGPSGKSYTIEGPQGATADQLGQVILSNSHDERVAAEYQRGRAEYNPTNDMGTTERLLSAGGRGMASVGRALGQVVGITDQNDVNEAKQLDAPLLNTTAGKIGNAVGTAAALAPVAFIPGANTLAGAAAIGAGTGALTTEGGLVDRAEGAVGGALGGAAGYGIGKGLGMAATAVKNRLGRAATANAPRTTAVQTAQDAGYVLPPNEVNPDLKNALAQAWAGPIKTTQAAAVKNQQTTNKLARAALGMEEEAPITKEALTQIRADAGEAYDQVRGIGQVEGDSTFLGTLSKLKSKYVSAASDFPDLIDSKVTSALDAIAKPSFKASSAVDAIRILRDRAATAFAQGDKGVANDLKGGADALEGAIERTLERRATPVYAPKAGPAAGNAGPALTNGAPGTALTTKLATPEPQMLEQVGGGVPSDLLSQFRDARKLIAKTYDVEKALQGENVNAAALARIQKKKGYLTNELAQIADAAANFPKATRLLTEAPSPYSAVDAGFSAAQLAHPGILASIAARPLVRSALLSSAGQRFAAAQPGPTIKNALAQAAQSRLTRGALLVGGITAPNLLVAPAK